MPNLEGHAIEDIEDELGEFNQETLLDGSLHDGHLLFRMVPFPP